jgi:hypothetical protein
MRDCDALTEENQPCDAAHEGPFHFWTLPNDVMAGHMALTQVGHHAGKVLCVPSHIGALLVRLQVQKKTRPDLSAVYFIGENVDPLWLPSQNGCFDDLPQVHHQ